MAIALERCAEMRAEMDAGALRDDVLLRAGVSGDEWTVSQREWLDKMGAEVALGRFELTNRYTQAFLERQRALAVRAPAPAALPAVSPPVLPPPVLPPPVIPPPVLPAPVLPAPVLHAPVLPPTAMPVAAHAPAPISPWAEESAAAEGPVTVPSRPPAGESTGQPAPSPLRDALPFRPAAPGETPKPASPPDRAEPAPRRPAQSGKTAAIPMNPALMGTIMGAAPPLGDALPFMRTKPGAEPPKPPPPAHAAPPHGAPAPPAPAARDAGAGSQPPPPPGAAPSNVGGLTLEQHASLCAEIAHAPAHVNDVLSRYRVTPEAKAGMDQTWKARFAADPSLERRWHEAYRLYASFLAGAARPRTGG